ncbi:hypothetical protein IT409_01745 [Candidatus Falkowbacteria bacterium]|nr:hypothetical protein [Candidatus Falkowbacteria bacterium]
MKNELEFRAAYSAFVNALEMFNHHAILFSYHKTKEEQKNKYGENVVMFPLSRKPMVSVDITPFPVKEVLRNIDSLVFRAWCEDRDVSFIDLESPQVPWHPEWSGYIDEGKGTVDARLSEGVHVAVELVTLQFFNAMAYFQELILIDFVHEEQSDTHPDEIGLGGLSLPLMVEKMIASWNAVSRYLGHNKCYDPNLLANLDAFRLYWRTFFAPEEMFWFLEKLYASKLLTLIENKDISLRECDEEEQAAIISAFTDRYGHIIASATYLIYQKMVA